MGFCVRTALGAFVHPGKSCFERLPGSKMGRVILSKNNKMVNLLLESMRPRTGVPRRGGEGATDLALRQAQNVTWGGSSGGGCGTVSARATSRSLGGRQFRRDGRRGRRELRDQCWRHVERGGSALCVSFPLPRQEVLVEGPEREQRTGPESSDQHCPAPRSDDGPTALRDIHVGELVGQPSLGLLPDGSSRGTIPRIVGFRHSGTSFWRVHRARAL